MKVKLKEQLPLFIVMVFFSLIVTGFTLMEMAVPENWVFHVMAKASLSLLMFLCGVNAFVYKDRKMVGYGYFTLSALVLLLMTQLYDA